MQAPPRRRRRRPPFRRRQLIRSPWDYIDKLPEQIDEISLVSVGLGSRFSIKDHFHASLDAGMPLRDAGIVEEGDWLMTFRLWTDF